MIYSIRRHISAISNSVIFFMANPPSVTTLVLDAGPIIANTTLPRASKYYTTPAVLAELKDESARSRLTSLYDLQIRAPRLASVVFVRNFAKKTGDAEVLSGTDIGVIALTYELECEQNGGDWRLKNEPGQKQINGSPPVKTAPAQAPDTSVAVQEKSRSEDNVQEIAQSLTNTIISQSSESTVVEVSLKAQKDNTSEVHISTEGHVPELTNSESAAEEEEEEEDLDDADDWITPSNLKKHQDKDANVGTSSQDTRIMQVACATHDFALQNVLMQIGLNLVSGDGKRIKSVKTWVLRCHACFKITRKQNQKFCPSCGGATLLRTSVSTDKNGAMKVHLKKTMQWSNRGTVYSIPKQQQGTANMKGRDNLILRADQREVEKLEKRDRYKKEIDLLDPDYIPSIVSGRRDTGHSSVRFGHGKRNPNSNRKH